MYAATAAAALALVAGASAFVAPSAFNGAALQAAKPSAAVTHMSAEGLIGADTETNGVWDPAGFAKDEAKLGKYRAIELKHGRIAMLGALGMFVQSAGIHMPDPVFSESKPIDAFFKVINERPAAAIQVLLAITWLELNAAKGDRAPGDLGFGENFKPADADDYAALQLKELKNGRLAMMAFFGMLAQESLTGQNVLQQIGAGNINPFGDGQGFF